MVKSSAPALLAPAFLPFHPFHGPSPGREPPCFSSLRLPGYFLKRLIYLPPAPPCPFGSHCFHPPLASFASFPKLPADVPLFPLLRRPPIAVYVPFFPPHAQLYRQDRRCPALPLSFGLPPSRVLRGALFTTPLTHFSLPPLTSTLPAQSVHNGPSRGRPFFPLPSSWFRFGFF